MRARSAATAAAPVQIGHAGGLFGAGSVAASSAWRRTSSAQNTGTASSSPMLSSAVTAARPPSSTRLSRAIPPVTTPASADTVHEARLLLNSTAEYSLSPKASITPSGEPPVPNNPDQQHRDGRGEGQHTGWLRRAASVAEAATIMTTVGH